MFGRLKDWSRIAMRYDRCAYPFFSAICRLCFHLLSHSMSPEARDSGGLVGEDKTVTPNPYS